MRKAILHYHLFKNAGTSLDAALKGYFKPEEWATKEFPGNHQQNADQLAQWILNTPTVKCYSSHTAFLPAPEVKQVEVLPVIFIRHPIDRIVSAYSFEKNQQSDSYGAQLAKTTSMAGYIEARLALKHDRQCRNFQVNRFAMMFTSSLGNELARARLAIDKLPFYGIVDKFSDSLSNLSIWLESEGFEGIKLTPSTQNVSQNASLSIADKLKTLKQKIGDELYAELLKANDDDINFYQYASERFKVES